MTLAHLAPAPRSRAFIVGATGSGKSVLLAELVEEYHRLHPRHRIVIIDPKPHFFVERRKEYGRRVFPFGARSVVRKKREGVIVNGRLIRDGDSFAMADDEMVFVIQSVPKALSYLMWRLKHPDVIRPTLAVFDESVQFIGHTRADAPVRETLQLGREIGLGSVLIHQTPTWVDNTFASESERLFVGHLGDEEHRKKIMRWAALPKEGKARFADPVPMHTWWMIDQRAGRAYSFTLNLEGS